jgi:hypothetical protein
MRLQLQHYFDLIGSHPFRWYQRKCR